MHTEMEYESGSKMRQKDSAVQHIFIVGSKEFPVTTVAMKRSWISSLSTTRAIRI